MLVALLNSTANAQVRNPKKGLSFDTAHTCDALTPHTASSWWYSWSPSDGFPNSWCSGDTNAPGQAAKAAGMEFVPMFWGGPPSNFTAHQIANLNAATYLMSYNEPDRTDQANKDPAFAAQQWPNFVAIANQYSLQLVAPCVTQDGYWWYDQWLANCTAFYGAGGCQYEHTCIHMYFQPYQPSTSSCKPGVLDWACIGPGASQAKSKISKWYNDYGQKPIWITELACAGWGFEAGYTGIKCTEADHQALMNQLVPVLEADPVIAPYIFRYAWFTMYTGSELDWIGARLNDITWNTISNGGYGCANRAWMQGWSGTNNRGTCVAKADNDANCAKPLTLMMDDDGCYCARDDCSTFSATWGAMKIYRDLGNRGAAATLTSTGILYNGATSSPPPPPPTTAPTLSPTTAPTLSPTTAPTKSPTTAPTKSPTPAPTKSPTAAPTKSPTAAPTKSPTAAPTPLPTPQCGPCGTIVTRSNCRNCAVCRWTGSAQSGSCSNV
ncbi:hypothetical protein ACA910_003497 [Epithemia clementina (nom. ined.)]